MPLCHCPPKLFVLPAFVTAWQKESHSSLKAAIKSCFSDAFSKLGSA